MIEQERAAGQAASTGHVGGGATEAEREAVAREIGALLAQARESQRMSVEDVSARLKVAAPKLAAIEGGHVDSLPDITFAKGVMRAYARMLHVDADACSRAFIRARCRSRKSRASVKAALTRRSMTAGALGPARQQGCRRALGLAGAGGCRRGRRRLVRARSYETMAGSAQQRRAGRTSRSAGACGGPGRRAWHRDGCTATRHGWRRLSGPVRGIACQPRRRASASNVAVPAPVAQAATAAPVANSATVAATAPAQGELQIKFSGDTWYEIRDRSGKVVLGGTAKAGQEVAGGGTAPYKVTIGNVKGVESMRRNGTPVDLKAANRNNVARLTLP